MTKLPITRPWIGEPERGAVLSVLDSGWLTQGPQVRAFEQAFAARTGATHACAVNSGTSALHLALLALQIGPGDTVLTVSHSFIATANAIRACGAEPYFVDIDPSTLNMDPAALERVLDQVTAAAILVVHQVGMPANLPEVLALANARGIPVIEDAACAAGSEVSLDGGASWEPIGRPHGSIACFSFHPRKIITTGEGGLLTCTSDEHDHTVRQLRHNGMSGGDESRHYERVGFNCKMTDLQAAIGIAQLARLKEIVARRRALAQLYTERLAALPGIRPPLEPSYARSNWQSYVATLQDPENQAPLIMALRQRDITAQRGVMCAHREPAYANAAGAADLPNSERAMDTGLILPLYPQLTAEDVHRVCDALAELLQ